MKLRVFLILYTVFATFSVYDIFFDKNSYHTLGTAILLCCLAILSAAGLLIAILWDKTQWRIYFLAMLWVGLPPMSIWIKDLRLFDRNDAVKEIILK